ncbi:MAG: GDP-mannose 4,6-dehydratase, partial [Bacteroidetes bacterium]|nr:GDP-mannose 4,6-dehydratase [Bacteroidota bacterium]
MKILITGAAGFIGSHLSETLLNEGHEIVGFDNFDPFYDREIKERNLEKSLSIEAFSLIEGDLNNSADMKTLFSGQKYDVVIHLAAKAGVRPSIKHPLDYTK